MILCFYSINISAQGCCSGSSGNPIAGGVSTGVLQKKQLEFSETNAQSLVENSTEFDNWLNEVVFDLENFRTNFKGKDKAEAKDIS